MQSLSQEIEAFFSTTFQHKVQEYVLVGLGRKKEEEAKSDLISKVYPQHIHLCFPIPLD
jgi:hypothetical protein